MPRIPACSAHSVGLLVSEEKHVQYMQRIATEDAILPFPAQTVNKDLEKAHGEDTRRQAHAHRLRHARITFTPMLADSEKQAGTALWLGLFKDAVTSIDRERAHTHFKEKYMNL